MKLKVEKEKLDKVIKRILSLAKVKAALPILSDFHISVQENEMFLTAGNLEIWGVGKTECESKDKFKFCVDAQKLAAIVSNSYDTLKFAYDDKAHKLVITYGHSTHRLSTEPEEDFPQPAEIENPKTVKIPDIAKIFKRTMHTVDKGELRRNMCGVFIGDKSIRATDGFRAIVNHVETGVEAGLENGIFVPKETANIIAGLVESDIEFAYNKYDIKVIAGDITYHSKLIDDTPPNIDGVIPKEFTIRYSANTAEFKKAIRTILISADPLDTTKRTELEFNNEIMIISASNNEIGAESTDQIPYKLEMGEPTFPAYITINGGYLLDLLNIIETDEIAVDISSFEAGKPQVIKNEQFTYLLMPLRKH